MRIINLTQHVATKDQISSGVFDVSEEYIGWLKEIMTFDEIPDQKELDDRAHDLGLFAAMYDMIEDDDSCRELYPTHALIGGAPFFMSTLEKHLLVNGIVPLYAFSVRESKEITLDDGSVGKVSVFKHKGFISI